METQLSPKLPHPPFPDENYRNAFSTYNEYKNQIEQENNYNAASQQFQSLNTDQNQLTCQPHNPNFIYSPNLNLTSNEIPFYKQLWKLANPQDQPVLNMQQGADFLNLSGLPKHVLHEIWKIADNRSEGQLNFEAFCIACRLVAFAQNGLPVMAESLMHEAPTAPYFETRQTHSSVSDINSISGATPIRKNSGLDAFTAAAAMGSCAGAVFPSTGWAVLSKPLSREEQSADKMFCINDEEIEKYSNLMQRLRLNSDGNLPGDQARVFLSRSGLTDAQLAQIWTLADIDSDGCLNRQEFVIAMHLISICRRGVPIPNSLPPELEILNSRFNVFQKKARKDDLSKWENYQQLSQEEKPSKDSSNWLKPNSVNKTVDPFAQNINDTNTKQNFTNFDSNDFFSNQTKTFSPDKQKKKKDKPGLKKNLQKSFGELVLSEKEKPINNKSKMLHSSNSDDDHLENETYEPIKLEKTSRKKTKKIVNELDLANKSLIDQVKRVVNIMSENLLELTNLNETAKFNLLEEKKELYLQFKRRENFKTQVNELRIELDEVQEKRRKIELEHISAARDIDHYQNEIIFLKRQLDMVVADVKQLHNSNAKFEKGLKLAENETRQLNIARKTAMGIVEAEQANLRRQEEEIKNLRVEIEVKRKEKEELYSKYAVLQEKLRQAEQDRSLLLTSTETERAKVEAVQLARLEAADTQVSAIRMLADVTQGNWAAATRRIPSAVSNEPSISDMRFASTGPQLKYYRDAKGIPSGAVNLAAAPTFPAQYSNLNRFSNANDTQLGNDLRTQFSSANIAPNFWTGFGSQLQDCKKPSYYSSLGIDKERRGVDRIARELTLGGSSQFSNDFSTSKEKSSLGSRHQKEKLKLSYKINSSASSSEEERKKLNEAMKKKVKNVNTRGTKKKKKDSFSENVSTDKHAGLNDKSSICADAPSFGTQSFGRVNSFS